MQITKETLRQIVKEELDLRSMSDYPGIESDLSLDQAKKLAAIATKAKEDIHSIIKEMDHNALNKYITGLEGLSLDDARAFMWKQGESTPFWQTLVLLAYADWIDNEGIAQSF